MFECYYNCTCHGLKKLLRVQTWCQTAAPLPAVTFDMTQYPLVANIWKLFWTQLFLFCVSFHFLLRTMHLQIIRATLVLFVQVCPKVKMFRLFLQNAEIKVNISIFQEFCLFPQKSDISFTKFCKKISSSFSSAFPLFNGIPTFSKNLECSQNSLFSFIRVRSFFKKFELFSQN